MMKISFRAQRGKHEWYAHQQEKVVVVTVKNNLNKNIAFEGITVDNVKLQNDCRETRNQQETQDQHMWEEKRNCPAMHEKRGWNTTS
jgi:hypothetical protein